jgi:TldD protein
MRELLKAALSGAGCDDHIELRYHNKVFRSLTVQNGKLERSTTRRREGVGVRVLSLGNWGFAATDDLTVTGVQRAIEAARISARATANLRSDRVELASVQLAVGDFAEPGIDEVMARSLDARISLVLDAESRARKASTLIQSASSTYNEIVTHKSIVTSDGADVSIRFARPELYIQSVASSGGTRTQVSESVGVTGGWDCLFGTSVEAMAEKSARTAVDLLTAKAPEGGRSTIILAPAVVGLLVHEAIGHTVEADFVTSGSVAKGKLGERVASELVTLCDSGDSAFRPGAGGTLPIDDEGVVAGRTAIIEDGILKSYLHDRQTAARFGVAPTGNARAWEYSDKPLIRMRNTYIEPGDRTLDDIIASTDEGYLLDGARNGQADATGEFTFGVVTARRIRKGQLGELVRGVTVTGNAFDVLRSVDAVSQEFSWDLGSGHCGKGQPAKVDAGGPYIRCQALLGGTQA